MLQMIDAGDAMLHGQRNRDRRTLLVGMDLACEAKAECRVEEPHQQRTARGIGIPLQIGEARETAAANLEHEVAEDQFGRFIVLALAVPAVRTKPEEKSGHD